MSETQNKAWTLTWSSTSFNTQPEDGQQISPLAPPAHTKIYLWALVCWFSCWTMGVQQERRTVSGGCFFLWKGLRRGTALCYVPHREARSQPRALGRGSGTPIPRAQLLGSWVCFAPFISWAQRRKAYSVGHIPTFSLGFQNGFYGGTLSKDLAFMTFTLDFSSQSVSLSHFILSKYAKSVRTVYL